MDDSRSRVLVVDDDEDQRTTLARMVTKLGYAASTAADGVQALERLSEQTVHVMITDMMMPRMDGSTLLETLREKGGGPPAIVMTAYGSVEKAVTAVKDLGAFWFLEKPIAASELSLLLERAASQSRLREEAERLHRQLSYQGILGDMVGASQAMQQVFSLVRQVAEHNASVLITGESGTGKELAARAIHRLGKRSDKPFVAINCAALPDTLIESELFGHEKGAFTGAVGSRPGCFELAHNGTLLLDEIGDMPIATQAKLLRVLEDSQVRRLGGKSETKVDVQIIAATNKDPEQAVEDGQLRMDLFYRLNVFQITLPPLRERMDDLPVLVEALLPALNEKYNCRVAEVDRDVLDAFRGHHWPGNVRELRNLLARAVIVAGEGSIGVRHLPPGFAGLGKTAPPPPPGDDNGIYLQVGATVREAERALIEKTLDYAENNKTRAAAILGIGLKTLHNKLKQYRETDA